jgi:hypothetical protein
MLRISGCYYLLELFRRDTKLRYVLRGTLCISTVHGIVSMLEVCLICRPLAAQFDPKIEGLCGNQLASFVIIEVSGLVHDTVLLVSPIPCVLGMDLRLVQKLKVLVALDIGAM